MEINFKQGKKYFISGFVVVVLVVGVVMVLKNKEIEIKFDENGRMVVPDKKWYEGQMEFAEKVVDLQERLVEMKKLDDFGGATPQETFDAFVEALKKGDTKLASLYFVFNKQEQMAKELEAGKENGNLDFLIGYLEKVDTGKEIRDKLYRFTVIEKETAIMSFDLEFNEYTKVWKLESL